MVTEFPQVTVIENDENLGYPAVIMYLRALALALPTPGSLC
jgi:hypothetical protein